MDAKTASELENGQLVVFECTCGMIDWHNKDKTKVIIKWEDGSYSDWLYTEMEDTRKVILRDHTFEVTFMREANLLLPSETYLKIIERAHEYIEANHG